MVDLNNEQFIRCSIVAGGLPVFEKEISEHKFLVLEKLSLLKRSNSQSRWLTKWLYHQIYCNISHQTINEANTKRQSTGWFNQVVERYKGTWGQRPRGLKGDCWEEEQNRLFITFQGKSRLLNTFMKLKPPLCVK